MPMATNMEHIENALCLNNRICGYPNIHAMLQVVHDKTCRVGCGYAYCPNSKYGKNYVCNYAFG